MLLWMTQFISLSLFSPLADPDMELVATGCAVMIKFFVSINFYVSNLQAMETYPTCLRQTGISIGSIVANIFGMLGPYVVLLVSDWSREWEFKLILEGERERRNFLKQ